MLVDNSIYRNSYKGNGVTKTFTISFPFLDPGHIIVYQSSDGTTETVVPRDMYTVYGAGNENGGHITFNTAPSSGQTIAILRDIPITQLYNYTELDNFPAESHENALAKLTMICQQLFERLERAVSVPATDEHTPEEYAEAIFTARDEAQVSASAAAQSAANAKNSEQTSASILSQTQQAGDDGVAAVMSQQAKSVNAVIAQGDAQYVRLESLAQNIVIATNTYNEEITVDVEKTIPAGTVITLPEGTRGNQLVYFVGEGMLRLGCNGVQMYSGDQFEEVGNPGMVSSQIKVLFDVEAGSRLNIFIISRTAHISVVPGSGLAVDADGRLTAAPLISYVDNLFGGNMADAFPGDIKIYAGTDVPVGFLLCDGSAVSRTTYSNLFLVIGTRYGSGDGSTTFNLPNLIDRFVQGSTTAGTVKDAGLPNITGWFQFTTGNKNGYWDKLASQSGGVFQSKNDSNAVTAHLSSVSKSDAGTVDCSVDFNASRANQLYGASMTVQPPAVTMRYVIKF